ncbi:MAG TPA: class II aldolase/adducin family protein [Stellaceae bacterium]|nr:class II aldolase/adducin family protein [Stellaceae bacterium]
MASRNGISAAEWETRVELAAAFRAAHHFGWNRTISNHMTARLPDNHGHFLMNARGFGWHEITAANLIKLDLDGNVLSETELMPGPAGLNFHSAILRQKPDIACTMHLHTMEGVVVSALEEGLQFYDQEGCAIYDQVTYHAFEGLAEEKDEAPRIIADLGDKFTMIMRNHGLLSVGRTVGEAFTYMEKLIRACDTQVRILATGAPARRVPKEVLEHTARQMKARQGNKPAGELEWKMYKRLVTEGAAPPIA